MAAAVGSVMILRTLMPLDSAALMVAFLWKSSKYAGTVMTASVISSPSNLSSALRMR